MDLEVRNPTRGNWERVQVVLDIPSGVAVYLDEDDPLDAFDAPDRPATYGSSSALAVMPTFRRPKIAELNEIDRSGAQTRVRFAPFHLRPGAVERLDSVCLLPDHTLAGSNVEVAWRATSTSAHGWAAGVLTLHVGEEVAILTTNTSRGHDD